MKLFVISPSTYLDLSTTGDGYFILAQRVLRDEQYAEFYKARQDFKLLDNGAFEEGVSLPWEKVLDAAKIVSADEIVLPDKPGDPDWTIAASNEAYSVMSDGEKKRYQLMAVPHGKNIEEYIACYQWFRSAMFVSTIGFSILTLWKWNRRLRPLIIRYLNRARILTKDKEYHLLGLDEPLELFSYYGLGIRSVDTSLPISLAHEGKEMTLEERKHKRVEDYSVMSSAKIGIAKKNINELKEICHEV